MQVLTFTHTDPQPLSLAPSQSEPIVAAADSQRGLRLLGALCGLAGPLALTVYFAAPAFTGWPYAGASADELIRYANAHAPLFYAGAWFQSTGALLSVLFFLVLVQLAGARERLAGQVTTVASALLLGVVLMEAALLVAVPMAAANGDAATVATTFALSNGVFARVFPLGPAPAVFAGLGAVLLGSHVLPRGFGWAALALAALFELAGLAAIVSPAGLYACIALSIVQEVWIVGAAVALGRSARA